MEDSSMILPKGTIVKVNGCPVELLEETEVKGLLITDNDTSSSNKPFNNDGGAMEEYPAVLYLT